MYQPPIELHSFTESRHDPFIARSLSLIGPAQHPKLAAEYKFRSPLLCQGLEERKMSKARGLVPMAIATVIGIGTGFAIFDPAFKEDKEQKERNG